MMGEKVEDEIDPNAYVSVELKMNQESVIVKRKRLILLSEKQKLDIKDEKEETVR